MEGIIFPENWERIMKKEVIEKPSISITVEELEAELIRQLRTCLKFFNGNNFCLALSGGIDSSILAVLLSNFLRVDFTAITIGRINHPDILFAELLTEKFRLNHKVSLLFGSQKSDDIYDDLFAVIAQLGFGYSIHADAIDELTGGYWLHRRNANEETFQDYWERLTPEHLRPMAFYAERHRVSVGLPYLATHNLLRRITMKQRTANGKGKIILRQLAKKLDIPDEIIDRSKLGLCDVWKEF